VADWVADEVPFGLQTANGPRLALPYIEVHETELTLPQRRSGPEFRGRLINQSEQLGRDEDRVGLVMAIALHPFLVGPPHRIPTSAKVLDYLRNQEGCGLPPGADGWASRLSDDGECTRRGGYLHG
jgi:allantoinase